MFDSAFGYTVTVASDEFKGWDCERVLARYPSMPFLQFFYRFAVGLTDQKSVSAFTKVHWLVSVNNAVPDDWVVIVCHYSFPFLPPPRTIRVG